MMPAHSISIHALHEESDHHAFQATAPWNVFQSTLSMRRATMTDIDWQLVKEFQSTLSMRRATSTP